jgi:sugar O-acyltransferase (sialic acid O-acetyltransferase NeuD family)
MNTTLPGEPAPRELIIVCAGGHAREVAWVASEATKPWRVRGFLDDRPALHGQSICGIPVLGSISSWIEHPQAAFIVAIGSPHVRRDIVERMERLGQPDYATLVHRSATLSPNINIAEGTMVMAGCVLSTQIDIGRHVILNQSTVIAHDVRIESHCTLAPRATLSGNVTVLEGAEIGASACIRQGITIGRGALVGMGAVVTKDVSDAQVAYGNPARPQRTLVSF